MTYHVQFLLLVLAGWVNRQQQDVIDYLQEENRVLRAGLRGKRLRFSDDDRRRLAVKAQALGREALAQIASVATPRYASALVPLPVVSKNTNELKTLGRLGPVANKDTKLLIYGFSKGPSFSTGRESSSRRRSRMRRRCDHRTWSVATSEQPARTPFRWQTSPTLRRGKVSSTSRLSSTGRRSALADNSVPVLCQNSALLKNHKSAAFIAERYAAAHP